MKERKKQDKDADIPPLKIDSLFAHDYVGLSQKIDKARKDTASILNNKKLSNKAKLEQLNQVDQNEFGSIFVQIGQPRKQEDYKTLVKLFNNIAELTLEIGHIKRAIKDHQDQTSKPNTTTQNKDFNNSDADYLKSYTDSAVCYQHVITILNKHLKGVPGSYRDLGIDNPYKKLDQIQKFIVKSVSSNKSVSEELPEISTQKDIDILAHREQLTKLREQVKDDIKLIDKVKGRNYKYIGNHSKSLPYALKAVSLSYELLGEKHPFTVSRLSNLSYIYSQLGDNHKALAYYLKSLHLSIEVKGDNNVSTAKTMSNLGVKCIDFREYGLALSLQLKSLQIYTNLVERPCHEIALILDNISAIYYRCHQYSIAFKYICDAYSMHRAAYGEEHPNTVRSKKALCLYYSRINKEDWNSFLQNDIEDQSCSLPNKTILTFYQQTVSLLKEMPTGTVDSTIVMFLNKIVAICNGDKNLMNEKQLASVQADVDHYNQLGKLARPSFKNHDEQLPNKEDGHVRVVSYNIVADYFDEKDKTTDKHHHWSVRCKYIKKMLSGSFADVICLQELSATQASELGKSLAKDGYNSTFLVQTQSEVRAGEIVYGDRVEKWTGKYTGTSINAIFVKGDWKFDQGKCNRFWLKEEPDEPPSPLMCNDVEHKEYRGKVDMGFGNMNSYRAVIWSKLYNEKTGQEFYIFNSHYPLSGGNKTRLKCAELEMQKIKEIVKDSFWVSCGDRNVVPNSSDTKEFNPETVYKILTNNAVDIRDSYNHFGVNSTWIGFSYDKYKNEIKSGDFVVKAATKKSSVLDIMVSNKFAKKSFHHPGGFDPKLERILSSIDALSGHQNEDRYFASDHAMIGADFDFSGYFD